jgi:hypothetical protein
MGVRLTGFWGAKIQNMQPYLNVQGSSSEKSCLRSSSSELQAGSALRRSVRFVLKLLAVERIDPSEPSKWP